MQKLGRYEILAELGRGAMGTVFQARDPKIDRTVAIKTISVKAANAAEEAEYLQRFFREAQAAGKLAHPGIVTVFDVGDDEGTKTPYIVMEYIPGSTMDAIAKHGAVVPATALELVQQVAEALHYAHAQGIVHRDIKPANVIVTEDGRAKVMDFGVAKLTSTEYTVAGQVLGTPSYMSPEQLTGDGLDGRSDLFSLGIVLYLLLTGTKPFTGESVSEITYKVVNKDPAPATQLNSALTPDADYVLGRALAKSPANRYQTGSEFAQDLQDLRNAVAPRSRSKSLAAKAAAATAPIAERTVQQPPSSDRTVAVVAHSDHTLPMGSTASPQQRLRKHLLPWWSAHSWKFRAAVSLAPLALAAAVLFFLAPHSADQAKTTVTDVLSPAASSVVQPASQGTAILRVRGTHPFHHGEMNIYVDGDPVRKIPLRGAGIRKKYFMFKEPVAGRFDETLSVSTGDHKVRVQVTNGEEYDQSQEIEGDFNPNLPKTLRVSVHLHSLTIEWM